MVLLIAIFLGKTRRNHEKLLRMIMLSSWVLNWGGLLPKQIGHVFQAFLLPNKFRRLSETQNTVYIYHTTSNIRHTSLLKRYLQGRKTELPANTFDGPKDFLSF
jgi:hypothetical protein